MVWVAVSFGVLFAAASFLVYRLREEGNRLMQAIEDHYNSKNAPWGNPNIKTDVVDKTLWQEVGIE